MINEFGIPLREVIFASNSTPRQRRYIATQALRNLADLAASRQATTMIGVDTWSSDGISEFGLEVVKTWPAVNTECVMELDLTGGVDAVWRRLRRSYRPLISGLERRATLSISNPGTSTSVETLRLLHLQAAGRATRSLESWQIQADAVVNGDAFVCTVELDGEPVGATYVQISQTCAEYGVGAYRRDLQDAGIPVGHLTQWGAIRHLVEQTSVQTYTLGRAIGQATWQGKLGGINQFKLGFASRVVTRSIHQVTAHDAASEIVDVQTSKL